MPEGTYNAFNRSGSIVEDPDHVVTLSNITEKFGGWLHNNSCKEVAEYLTYRAKGLTFGEIPDYLDEHGYPDIHLETDDDSVVFTWDDDEGDYVKEEQ